MDSDKKVRYVQYLVNSAAIGDIDSVKSFIEDDDIDVNSIDDDGYTALYQAAGGGHYSIVEYLLSKGANVNFKIESDDPALCGSTPLCYAAMNGHVDVAKTLIQHGASTDVVVNGYNLLRTAAMSDNPSMIEFALGFGASIDDCSPNGRTPLIFAVGENNYESVAFLLEKGADYKKFTDKGMSALTLSVLGQGPESYRVTELLLKHVEAKEGKDGLVEYMNSVDPIEGRTALHSACFMNNYHAVKLLLEKGADYKKKDKKGSRPSALVFGDSHLCRQIRWLFGPYAEADLARSHER
ncbi:ankyrin repeat domain-containing protein [Wolbachia pipientis]|uniref:ankyrin repeat domain-containing protein n=1 Tax=Wolbachia TaxID=953 RepID=UPI0005127161|nr:MULTISPECIES: ankyrin repeat domain-containing protein [Wolbachia]MBA8765448.1 hypothetical protein [Wolbachia pipientis]QWE34440.1 Ankyrin repeat domain protein [Wolbachia endosymbiont of Drosophila simulans]CDR79009.1 ankyrin repeat domain protein,Ribulose-5-phosphate 4-epimerase and related epimerases and aldolases,transient-receptor-potential calcium channel protein,Ankyrin repeats (3 copies) [Wolbachia endosymbiont of Drosophila simulans wAu]